MTNEKVRNGIRDRQQIIAQVHLGVVRLGESMHLLRDTRPLAHAHDRIDDASSHLTKAADALLQAEALVLLEEQRAGEENKK